MRPLDNDYIIINNQRAQAQIFLAFLAITNVLQHSYSSQKNAKFNNQGSKAQLKQTLIATMVSSNQTFSIKQLNFC